MDRSEGLRRLKTAEGHIRGIERMLQEEAYCIDVIRQIQAVQSALSKISLTVVDYHLHSCLATAGRGDDVSARERVLQEIAEVFAVRKSA